MRVTAILFVVSSSALIAGCSTPTTECEGSVLIQSASKYPEALTLALTTFTPICDVDGAELKDVRIDVRANEAIPYFPADLLPDMEVVYTVVSDGPLEGESVKCTTTAEGVERNYVRMEVDPEGGLFCTCGFAENLTPEDCT